MTTRLEAMIQRERAATESWSIDAENGLSVFVTRTGVPVATFVRPEDARSAVRSRVDIPLLLSVADVMKYATTCPAEMQRVMREHGFVIDNLDEPWQKLAFTLYTELVELAEKAEAALAQLDVEEQP